VQTEIKTKEVPRKSDLHQSCAKTWILNLDFLIKEANYCHESLTKGVSDDQTKTLFYCHQYPRAIAESE